MRGVTKGWNISLMKVIDGATAGYLGGNPTRNLKIAGAYGPS